jgi:hypothetical protein
MSYLTDYFAAGSDAAAAAALDRFDGEPGLLELTPEVVEAHENRDSPARSRPPQVRSAHSGTLFLESKGIDPKTALPWLEAFLTDRPAREVWTDPRYGALVAPGDPAEIDAQVVLSVADGLRDALASLDVATSPEVARQWAAAEFDPEAADNLALLLPALADLSRQAVARSEKLYCLMTF